MVAISEAERAFLILHISKTEAEGIKPSFSHMLRALYGLTLARWFNPELYDVTVKVARIVSERGSEAKPRFELE